MSQNIPPYPDLLALAVAARKAGVEEHIVIGVDVFGHDAGCPVRVVKLWKRTVRKRMERKE